MNQCYVKYSSASDLLPPFQSGYFQAIVMNCGCTFVVLGLLQPLASYPLDDASK